MPALLLSYCSMGYGEIGVSRRLHCCCSLLIGDQGGYADTMPPSVQRPTSSTDEWRRRESNIRHIDAH